MSIDPRDNFRKADRLGDIIIGPGIQSTYDILLFGKGGEHDNGNFSGFGTVFQGDTGIKAIHDRHFDIKND